MAVLHIEQPNNSGGVPNLMNLTLIVVTVLADVAQSSAADLLYTWAWRLLSLVSLILLIYLNYNKAMEVYRGKKQQKDGGR